LKYKYKTKTPISLALLVFVMSKSSTLFDFAENEPEDPETRYYDKEVNEGTQVDLFEFER
jgi:hypothetical protein